MCSTLALKMKWLLPVMCERGSSNVMEMDTNGRENAIAIATQFVASLEWGFSTVEWAIHE